MGLVGPIHPPCSSSSFLHSCPLILNNACNCVCTVSNCRVKFCMDSCDVQHFFSIISYGKDLSGLRDPDLDLVFSRTYLFL